MKLEPGWFALVIALGVAYIQASTWWRSRHKVTATLGVMTYRVVFGTEPEVADLAEVTVSTVGRPCGVAQIFFHWTDESDRPSNLQWCVVQFDERGFARGLDMADVVKSGDLVGVRRTLADGDTWPWRFDLSTTSAEAAAKPRRFRAEVKLSSGKSIFTNHVYLRLALIGQP